MTLLTEAYAEGYAAALEKFAATRAMKEIAKSVAANTPQGMARANMIAKAPGVLNPNNTMGSQIRTLGGGAEGLATLVAHPEHGVAVRKMFDPNAPGYSPELIRRKEQLGSLPGAAAHYGSTKSLHGTPVHFNEFVQGTPVQRGQLTPEQQQATQKAMTSTNRALRQQGYHGRDIRDANMMMTPSGEAKVVDYLPFKKDEAATNSQQRKVRQMAAAKQIDPKLRDAMVLSPKGQSLFSGAPSHGYDPQISSDHPGQFNQYMFTGNATAPKPGPRGPNGTSIVSAPSAPSAPSGSPPANSPSSGGSWSSVLGNSHSLPPSAPTSMVAPAQLPTQNMRTPVAAPAPAATPPSRRTGLSEFL